MILQRLAIICLLCLPLSLAAQWDDDQKDEDSTYYEDDFVKDTLSTAHIGFVAGGNIQSLFYTVDKQSTVVDSLQYGNNSPKMAFTFGLVFDKEINDKWTYRTGLWISISQLNMQYIYRNVAVDYSFNYALLEIPLEVQYAFKSNKKGLFWTAGVKASFDITRGDDLLLRNYDMKKFNLLLGTGPGFRWQLSSGNRVSTATSFNLGIINLLTDDSQLYNQSLNSMHLWQIQLLLGIN
jgi:hypothetical protein